VPPPSINRSKRAIATSQSKTYCWALGTPRGTAKPGAGRA
jgi:hypothetical protein